MTTTARDAAAIARPAIVWALIAVALTLGVLAPFQLYPVFLAQALCFALFASAFNLLIGYAGLLSFGHAAFLGSAAYVTAYTLKHWNVTSEIGILLGTAVAALLGLVFGFLAIRRSGIYFAMVTLALAQMVFFFALQTPSFTGGEDGITAVPRGRLFGLVDLDVPPDERPLAMYYFVLAVFVLGLALIYRIIHSPFGQVLKAIRENEPRAVSLGYKVDRYKLAAFVMSATLAGLAGAVKALVDKGAYLSNADWHMSGQVVLMTLLGGIGTILGPTVGAFLVSALQYFLGRGAAVPVPEFLRGLLEPIGVSFREIPLPVPVVIGVIFVICVLLFRRGIVGEILRRTGGRRSG